VKAYYDRRAPEYDDWWRGAGRFAERDRPGWEAEVTALQAALTALEPARTLDVACGTGFLTRHLSGEIVGLDQSESMLAEARRVAGELVVADSAVRPDHDAIEWQERVLNDGSRWEVYKRYFVASEVAEELGDAEVLFDGNWFVVVRSRG